MAETAPPSFAERLVQSAKEAGDSSDGGIRQCVMSCIDIFKQACSKAAEQSHSSARASIELPLPPGVTPTTLYSHSAFSKLMKQELSKLKLIRPTVSFTCYSLAEVQEKVKGDDGNQAWKPLAFKAKDQSVLTRYPAQLNSLKQCTYAEKPIAYAAREQVLKKAKGSGMQVKVDIAASWPGASQQMVCTNGVIYKH